jgi:hypothetical protein
MFAAEEVSVGAALDVAVTRLTQVIDRDALHAPSEAAYEEGVAAVLRVGPFGSTRGLSKLVEVRWLDPIRHGRAITVPLRWEATGMAGELFPVLDADLVLVPDGADRTTVRLTGSYRPPFGRAGAALDRAIMHRITRATMQSLLASVAAAIEDGA